MEREHLQQTLRQLHEQLQSGAPIDPETEKLLQQISVDVDLRSARQIPDEPEGESETLMDRLKGLVEEFEDSHPQLAEAIGNVATALSRIGI